MPAINQLERPTSVFVGRQPIFFPNLEVYGYELLFRDSHRNAANVTDGDYATASVLINSLTDVGLDVLAESKHIFVNLPRSLLINANLSCIPVDQTVLEILEDVEPDEAVLQAVKNLSDQGYTIALDDFVFSPKLEPLIQLADIIKMEFPQIQNKDVPKHISQLRDLGVTTILVEKIETYEDFELCKRLGCDLFQGFFFCRPKVLSRQRPKTNAAAVLQLISKLHDPNISFSEVAEVIRSDVSLSYKILRCVNSTHFGFQAKIESISHATTLLGPKRLRSLASMLLITSLDDGKPEELMKTAIVRAKLCEQLAIHAGYENSERYFTVGLVSLLDAILDLSMDDVVRLLPLSNDMNEALLSYSGTLGDVLRCADALERRDTPEALMDGYQSAYIEALRWTAHSEPVV